MCATNACNKFNSTTLCDVDPWSPNHAHMCGKKIARILETEMFNLFSHLVQQSASKLCSTAMDDVAPFAPGLNKHESPSSGEMLFLLSLGNGSST